jgi:uncharacterized membrane protein YadS
MSYLICRLLGLTQRMSILIACGNSICGNSAIAAIAPVIGAENDEIASSISFTAVLGVVVVLGLPSLVPILHLSLTRYGVLAGLTVYAVPQVVAATLPVGALSNQVGTLIKLVRVLMLGPVVLGFSLFSGLWRRPGDNRPNRVPRLRDMVPWFISGFVCLIVIRSLGLIPHGALPRGHPNGHAADKHRHGGTRLGCGTPRHSAHRPARDACRHGFFDHARYDELRADLPGRSRWPIIAGIQGSNLPCNRAVG